MGTGSREGTEEQGRAVGSSPTRGRAEGSVGGKGHNGLCLLGHPDLQSWKRNRASLRLDFMVAQPAKNLPLVLSAPAAVQKRLELSVLG